MEMKRNKPLGVKPCVPVRHCRNCGKRITVYYYKKTVDRDSGKPCFMSTPNAVEIYTGEWVYRRNKNFCTATCAEAFAHNFVNMIDRGVLVSPHGTWNSITLGKGSK